MRIDTSKTYLDLIANVTAILRHVAYSHCEPRQLLIPFQASRPGNSGEFALWNAAIVVMTYYDISLRYLQRYPMIFFFKQTDVHYVFLYIFLTFNTNVDCTLSMISTLIRNLHYLTFAFAFLVKPPFFAKCTHACEKSVSDRAPSTRG